MGFSKLIKISNLHAFGKDHFDAMTPLIESTLAPEPFDSLQKADGIPARFELKELPVRLPLFFKIAIADDPALFQNHDLVAAFFDVTQEM